MLCNINIALCLTCMFLVTQIYCWDIALTSDSDITFLFANGTTERRLPYHDLNQMKFSPIAFDFIRQRVFVSNTEEKNNIIGIFSISLHNYKINTLSTMSKNDSIKGMVYDPISDTLYWIPFSNNCIMELNLKQPYLKPSVLLQLKEEIPQGISIDVCRRMLYWTNYKSPSIDSYSLEEKNHTVIIRDNLDKPTSIVVDQSVKKIFWTDMYVGIEFRIASADLDGSNHKILFIGRHQKPFGLVVYDEKIYWGDLTSGSIWSLKKDGSSKEAEKVYSFDNKHLIGLTTKSKEFAMHEECENVKEAISAYNESASDRDYLYDHFITENNNCLNGGEIKDKHTCECKEGFAGDRCEINLCHNFCVQGKCFISNSKYANCECYPGYTGLRCEHDICEQYCLNGGRCELNQENNVVEPMCKCEGEFAGRRCEQRTDYETLCRVFCTELQNIAIFVKQDILDSCRCSAVEKHYSALNSHYNVSNHRFEVEMTTSPIVSEETISITARLEDPLVIVLIISSLLLMFVVICLTVAVCWLRRRPRIKKRFVVNKNVTPLTCRPLPSESEQCEITIEDCCNMNVCDTPCFEPPQIRSFRSSKTDEKKTLLSSMENNEELY